MATSLKMTAVWDTPPPSSAWPQTTVLTMICVLNEYDTICNHPSYYTREWDLALGLISHETNLIWWLADISNSYRRQITTYVRLVICTHGQTGHFFIKILQYLDQACNGNWTQFSIRSCQTRMLVCSFVVLWSYSYALLLDVLLHIFRSPV
jgi:hypothetical protein